MKKEEFISIQRVITFLSVFPQTISLIRVENHDRTTTADSIVFEKKRKKKNMKIFIFVPFNAHYQKNKIVFIATVAP